MKLSKINLVNFRNYSNAVINFGKNMNVFIGDNAQGKTNILEAICYLALTKSHRVGTNPIVVKAVSVKGGKNSVNPVNVVISVEDADKILLANENTQMLNTAAVVFVK